LLALGIIAPLAVQAYGIQRQTDLGIAQSGNSVLATQSANKMVLGLGGLIQANGATTTYNNSNNDSTHTPAQPVIVRPEVIVTQQQAP
jgi:hypothetical protein